MEFKGTKGKWHMMKKGFDRKQNQNLIQIYATNEDLEMICQVWNDGLLHARTQNYDANAKLICSSPELLEALYELISLKKYKDEFGKDEWYLEKQPLAWINAQKVLEEALT